MIAFISDDGADVRLCTGEWSGHDRCSTEIIHWRQLASSPVTGQRRSPAGCWSWQWLHSVAEQSTGTATRPHWQRLSSRATESNTTLLQEWSNATNLRCTRGLFKRWRWLWLRLWLISSTLHLSVRTALSATDSSQLNCSTRNLFTHVNGEFHVALYITVLSVFQSKISYFSVITRWPNLAHFLYK